MNIIKLGLVLLAGLGFGFGVDQFAESNDTTEDEQYRYENGYYEYCHNDSYFLESVLENVTEEERLLVEAKIDELLLEYNITEDELYENIEIRYDFMRDLMDFLYENDINFHGYYEDDDRRYGMGMR